MFPSTRVGLDVAKYTRRSSTTRGWKRFYSLAPRPVVATSAEIAALESLRNPSLRLPPVLPNPAGRLNVKKLKRKASKLSDRLTGATRSYTCKVCGESGHSRAYCPHVKTS